MDLLSSRMQEILICALKKELATFMNKCKKLISMSYENSKIHVENLEKEIRRKDNITLRERCLYSEFFWRIISRIIKSICTVKKSVIPATSETEIDTTFSSPSNPPPVIAPNTKLQIRKWSLKTILITGDSMISGINEID